MAIPLINTQRHVAVLALVAIAVLVGINYFNRPTSCIQKSDPWSKCIDTTFAIAKAPHPLASANTIRFEIDASN